MAWGERRGSTATLAVMRPDELLPHRPPFLFVDEILDVVPGESASGRWHLTGEEAFFAGHFPCRPTLPGVLMVEAIAQLGGVALLAHDSYKGKLPLFAGIDKARFRRQVGPGDTLELEVVMDQLGATAGKGSGRALIGGTVACQADMFFALVPYETCEAPDVG